LHEDNDPRAARMASNLRRRVEPADATSDAERDLIATVETRLETALGPAGPPAGTSAKTDSGRELAQLRDTLERRTG
jgi:hypothetical protein